MSRVPVSAAAGAGADVAVSPCPRPLELVLVLPCPRVPVSAVAGSCCRCCVSPCPRVRPLGAGAGAAVSPCPRVSVCPCRRWPYLRRALKYKSRWTPARCGLSAERRPLLFRRRRRPRRRRSCYCRAATSASGWRGRRWRRRRRGRRVAPDEAPTPATRPAEKRLQSKGAAGQRAVSLLPHSHTRTHRGPEAGRHTDTPSRRDKPRRWVCTGTLRAGAAGSSTTRTAGPLA